VSTPNRATQPAAAPATLDLVEAAAQSKLEHALFGGGELVRIGRYVVIEHVGSGGFGDVYVAFDPKLDRKVALKLVRAQIRGGAISMLREAQALAKVAHPNVVAVHDAGVLDDPRGGEQLYIVMEFVDGLTLAQWLACARRPWRTVIAAFVAAARGLSAVHRADLVHHDFKPGNVLVGERIVGSGRDAPRGVPERVRVADFGLARLTGASHRLVAPAQPTTVIDAVREDAFAAVVTPACAFGTPAYMAPEQHFGRPTDARTDQFAFAVALFEALYGRRPFAGDNPGAIAQNKLHGRIVDAPHRGVPPRIRAVLRRALAPRPEDRHRDVDTLIAALERRGAKRRVLAVAAALAIAGAAALIVGGTNDRAAALAEVEVATRAARDAAALALFVYPLPGDADGTTAYRRVLELDELGSRAARTRAAELRTEFADTLTRLGDRYWELDGGHGFALDYYVQALVFVPDHARARERAGLPAGRLLAIEAQAASAAFTPAELRAAAPLVVLAQDDAEQRVAALQQLIDGGGQSVSARDELERLLAVDRAAAPVRTRPAATAATEQRSRATSAYDAAADQSAPAPPPSVDPPPPSDPASPERRDAPRIREALANGRALLAAGRWRDAEHAFHRAIELDKHNQPALAALAGLYFELRSYRKAREFARRAVALAPGDPQLRVILGDAAFKLLDYAEARTQYQRARALGSTTADRRLATLDEVTGASGP
jgi:tetratricopeptide (TPR) repeat protein